MVNESMRMATANAQVADVSMTFIAIRLQWRSRVFGRGLRSEYLYLTQGRLQHLGFQTVTGMHYCSPGFNRVRLEYPLFRFHPIWPISGILPTRFA